MVIFAQPSLTYREAHVVEEACRNLIDLNLVYYDGELSECLSCGADLLNDDRHHENCKVTVAQQLIDRLCGGKLPHEE